jgi:hypothetical protein
MRLPKITLYQIRTSGRWQWKLQASNGEKLCRGSQGRGFASPGNAWGNLKDSVRDLCGSLGHLPACAPTKARPRFRVVRKRKQVLEVVRIDAAA